MATITEQEIVTFLKDKIVSLKQELKKAEDGLAYFSGSASVSKKSSKQKKKSKAISNKVDDSIVGLKQSIDKPVQETKKAKIKSLKTPKAKTSKSIEIPTEFSNDLTQDRKILYALSKSGTGFAENVTETLIDLEPNDDRAKLQRLVTKRLSALKIAGAVKEKGKEGRKTEYSL